MKRAVHSLLRSSGVRAHWKLVLAALVLLHLVIAYLALFPAPHTGGDNAAYRALADNAWHLTLSADPAEAIDLLRANLARLGCTPPP